jgi:tartrate dehydratase alpha subunit/fumarate hydratase class I-like protein
VSRSCACIGSPCLRYCGHGASIGGMKGSVTQMDVQIGRLRTMLASKGVAQNTMLWFSSDK